MALQPNLSKAAWQGKRRAFHFSHEHPTGTPARLGYDPFRDDSSPSLEKAPFASGGAAPSYRKCPLCKDTGEVRCTGGEWDEILETFCECPIGQELQRAEDKIFGVAA